VSARESQQLSALNKTLNNLRNYFSKGSDAFANWAMTNQDIPHEQFKNLLTNSTQGDFNAKRELNKLALEYQEAEIKNYISHDYHDSHDKAEADNPFDVIGPNTVENNFHNQSESFLKIIMWTQFLTGKMKIDILRHREELIIISCQSRSQY
jgi:hypothetical protein